MKFSILRILPVLLLSGLIFCGCGNSQNESASISQNNPELDEFESNLNLHFNTIVDNAENIDNLNAEDAGASAQFLVYLDNISSAINSLSMMNIPSDYESIRIYTDTANENIQNACTLYHIIYDSGDYEYYSMENDYQAYVYYTEAISQLNQMGTEIINLSSNDEE